MVKPIEIINHSEEAVGKLLSQYQNAPNFLGFLDSFLNELNELETEFDLFKNILSLGAAEGKNLDLWGSILNAPTRPLDDETFRALLYGLIGAYYSSGTAADIKSVLSNLVTPTEAITIKDHQDGSFSVEVIGSTEFIAVEFASSIVDIAKCAGIIFNGITHLDSLYEPYFSFEGDTGAEASGFSVIGGDDGGFYGILI